MKVICIGKIIVLRDFMSKKIATITQKESVVAILITLCSRFLFAKRWECLYNPTLKDKQPFHIIIHKGVY